MNHILVFDIETAPNKELIQRVPPSFRAPAALTGPGEAMRWIAEKEASFPKSGAALDLDYARITAIGWAIGEGKPQSVVGDEMTALQAFWDAATKARVFCGYNIVGFDLPIIRRRSFVLGAPPTRKLWDVKPWDDVILDLMRRLYHDGHGPGVRYRSLKRGCERFGIKNALPDLDGSQAIGMDEETLRRYVENDVLITRELARRMKGHYW